MVKLYHYTTYDRLQRIKREKVIRASTVQSSSRRDMIHGAGVYLTALDPEHHSKDQIAVNNWAGGGQARQKAGNTDYYVEIEIPESDYRLVAGLVAGGVALYQHYKDEEEKEKRKH